MADTIKLLKNNDDRKWSDTEWIQEFYDFLTGQSIPDRISMEPSYKPKLTAEQAHSVIWFLQEHFSVLPDHIEQCDTCKIWYNSWSQGHYSELTWRCYCSESCEPPGLEEREQRAEKRARNKFLKSINKHNGK